MRIRKRTAQAHEWISAHRQELARDLMALIRIPSVTSYGEGGYPMGSGCHQAAEYLASLARTYGLQAENLDDHCVSIFLPGRCDEELGMLAHLDVVEAGNGWRHAPFDPVEKKGWIIGRGSSDCKGPLITALYVLRFLKESGSSLRFGVRLIAGCDEEREMRDVSHYLSCREAPLFTLNCDGMWPVGVAEKGILTVEAALPAALESLMEISGGTAVNIIPDEACAVVCRNGERTSLQAVGKSAHCQAPSLGENAIEKLIRQLCTQDLLPQKEAERLSALLPCFETDGSGLGIHYEDSFGQTTCAPTMIRLDREMLRLTLNIRYAPTQPYERLSAAFQRRCDALGLEGRILSCSPPRVDAPSRPEIRLLLETCREQFQVRWKPYATGGGTHSRAFPRSVPFGMGMPGVKNPFGGPHEADEAVCIAHLMKAVEVYIAALSRLDEHFYKCNLAAGREQAGKNGSGVEQ